MVRPKTSFFVQGAQKVLRFVWDKFRASTGLLAHGVYWESTRNGRFRPGTTPTAFARAAILEAVQLHHALTAEEREQVSHSAEAEGLSLTAFCRSAVLEAAAPAEHGAGKDADGIGFLAWLMAVISAARRRNPTRA